MELLTAEQLVELTGRVIPSAQQRELDHLRIPYKVRRDGTILVLRANAERVLTGAVASATFSPVLPNFDALNRRSK